MATVTSNYAGESSSYLVGKAISAMDVVQHARVITDVKEAENIGKIDLASVLQAYSASPSSFGSASFTEAIVEPKELMGLIKFNPRSLEKFWRPFQPSGPLDFRALPANVQESMLAEFLKTIGNAAAMTLIQGDTAGSYAAFDGIIKKAVAASGTIDVATPVALTSANIIAKLGLVVDATPLAVRALPDYKLFVSPATLALYEAAQHAQTNKGKDITEAGSKTIRGFKVVDLIGMPVDTIFAGNFGTGLDSNLVIAQDGSNDAVLVDKVSNVGEEYFMKLTTKLGVNCVRFEETVLYKA